MIPPVPLLVRLAMSTVCLVLAKLGFAPARWISPELPADGQRPVRLHQPDREAKP